MSKNEIAAREHFLPSVFQDKNTAKIRLFAEYEKISDAEYSFISRPDPDTEIRIVPDTIGDNKGLAQTDSVHAETDERFSSEPLSVVDDIVEAAYDELIPEKERPYYNAALACGLLCGALNNAPSVFSGFDFDRIQSFESSDYSDQGDGHREPLRSIVVFAAQLDGFKGKKYKKAIQ